MGIGRREVANLLVKTGRMRPCLKTDGMKALFRTLLFALVLVSLSSPAWADTPKEWIEQALQASDRQEYTLAGDLLLKAAESYRVQGNAEESEASI